MSRVFSRGIDIGYTLGELYKNNVSADKKQKWENTVKIHHGEAGIIIALAGMIFESSTFTGIGIGLALHDIDDGGKWFTGDKVLCSEYI